MKIFHAPPIALALVLILCASLAQGAPVLSETSGSHTVANDNGESDGVNWDAPCMVDKKDESRPLLRKCCVNRKAPQSPGRSHEGEKSEPIRCEPTHRRDGPKSTDVEGVTNKFDPEWEPL